MTDALFFHLRWFFLPCLVSIFALFNAFSTAFRAMDGCVAGSRAFFFGYLFFPHLGFSSGSFLIGGRAGGHHVFLRRSSFSPPFSLTTLGFLFSVVPSPQ